MAGIHIRQGASGNPGHNYVYSPGRPFPSVESIAHPFGHTSPIGKRVAQPSHQKAMLQHPSSPAQSAIIDLGQDENNYFGEHLF